jgi:hypothetical protein
MMKEGVVSLHVERVASRLLFNAFLAIRSLVLRMVAAVSSSHAAVALELR